MFSSIRRFGRSAWGRPSASSRAACSMQPATSAATASLSPAVGCASQMRISTVPKLKCGRTDHQTWVYSTIEFVRTRRST